MSYSKKIAVVLIAITISLFTVTMSVDALRDKLFSIIKMHMKSSQYIN